MHDPETEAEEPASETIAPESPEATPDAAPAPGTPEPEPEREPDPDAAAEGEESGEAEENGDGDDEDDADGQPPLPLGSVVEAVLFAAREPLKPAQIARAVGKGTRQEAVRAAMDELNLAYLESGRAFEIAEISGRYQLMSRPEYARHIMRLYPKRDPGDKDKTPKLTPAALETLTIIAYKQPVTRGEIEHIRGVGCGQTIRTLVERGSVAKKGKREDLVGQPPTYITTDAFLVEFGLGSLDELPMRHEIAGMFGPVEPAPESEPEAETAGTAAPAEAAAQSLEPENTAHQP